MAPNDVNAVPEPAINHQRALAFLEAVCVNPRNSVTHFLEGMVGFPIAEIDVRRCYRLDQDFRRAGAQRHPAATLFADLGSALRDIALPLLDLSPNRKLREAALVGMRTEEIRAAAERVFFSPEAEPLTPEQALALLRRAIYGD